MNAKLVILNDDGKEILKNFELKEIHVGHSQKPQIVITSKKDISSFYQDYKKILERGDIPLVLNPAIPIDKQREMRDLIDVTTEKTSGTQIICSSGTTSNGAVGKKFVFDFLTSLKNAKAHLDSIGLNEKKKVLLPLPVTHSFGLVAGLLGSIEGKHELYTSHEGELSPVAIIEAINQFDIDHLYLTPSLSKMLVKILKRRKEKITKVQSISIGSSLIFCEELIELMSFFPETKFYCTYGLTEMGPRAFTFFAGFGRGPEEVLFNNLKSPVPIGVPILGVEYKIVGDELLIKSPYRAINIQDGFFGTNDRAQVISDNIILHGRMDFTIIKSGINIYPVEVEGLFSSFEGVLDTCLIPKASENYGQVPVLIIQSLDDSDDFLERVSMHLKENLSSAIIPSRIIIRKEPFPKTSMGKTKVKQLIEEYENE